MQEKSESPGSEGEFGGIVPLSVAAAVLEIGEERIRQLVKAGYIPPGPRGKINIVAAIRGYVGFLKEDARKQSKSQAASRAVDARAAEIELRIAERKRELIPAEEAVLAMDLLVGEVNKQLAALPAQITRDMTLRREVEAKVDDAKQRIATAAARSGELVATGRDPSDPDAQDAAGPLGGGEPRISRKRGRPRKT